MSSFVDPSYVAAILRDLGEAAGGSDLETVIPPFSRAAAAIYAHFQHRPALSPEDRHALLRAWRLAENVAAPLLPPDYTAGRGGDGFAAAFGLLYGAGDGVGAPELSITEEDFASVALMARVFVNELDSVCAVIAMAKVDPGVRPLGLLSGAPYSHDPELRPAVTRH